MANIIKIDNAVLKRHKKQGKNKKKIVSCRILIVCEGEKTEPNYFKSFNPKNNESYVIEMDISGGGINTIDVVNKAIELKNNTIIPYDRVWAVFDKDDFSPKRFNGAIIKAQANQIEVAWSNEAFELWYLYHFNNRATAMQRKDYQKAISDAVNSSPLWKSKKRYVYAKNALDNYSIMNKFGCQENAIKWAEKQSETFKNRQYANHNPSTTVYQLVCQLLNKDKKLIADVMQKING